MLSTSQNKKNHGFSLLELLVALSILGLITSIIAPNVIRYLDKSQTKTAKIQIESVRASLEMFRLDLGRYPTQEEGLRALWDATNIPFWDGPYIDTFETLKDPWGQPYQYIYPSETGRFDVFSYGPDGLQDNVALE